MEDFKNKVVIVTGASSGIGLGIVERYIKDGAKVIAVARDEKKLNEAINDLPVEQIRVVAGDASEPDTAQKAISTALEFGGKIDILVNGVGNAFFGSTETLEVSDFNQALQTNVTSAFVFSKFALPELIKTKGNIINISSIQSLDGELNSIAYNSTKAALNNLTRSMALDVAKDGVRINAIAPGFIETPRTAGVSDKMRQAYINSTPLKRTGTVADVADSVEFLSSDKASFITGTILVIDGGRTAGGHAPKL